MPIYEYRCGACGTEFELMRSRALIDAPAACPACPSKSAARKLSIVAPLRVAVAPPGDPDFKNPYFDDDEDEADL